VSTQLRLVDQDRPAPRRRARVAPRRATRAARWNTDWRLDARTRRVGREGIAAARDALSRAADESLPQAS
jgi:hypothetical protein